MVDFSRDFSTESIDRGFQEGRFNFGEKRIFFLSIFIYSKINFRRRRLRKKGLEF